MSTVGIRRVIVIAFGAWIGVAWAPVARAQVPTINPGGDQGPQPPSQGPPPNPYATPAMRRQQQIIIKPTVAAPSNKGGKAKVAPHGVYHYDDLFGQGTSAFGVEPGHGSQADVHVVQPDDTLWGISQLYFNDPWKWPKIWALNPQITNPHWIYPGDIVRLRPKVNGAGQPAGAGAAGGVTAVASLPRTSRRMPKVRTASFSLRQLAFIGRGDLKASARISGAPEEQEMLAQGDKVYLAAATATHLRVGKRYAIYAKKKQVRHPRTGKVVGWYVKLLGELKVLRKTPGQPAQAVITRSYDVVERGDRVGPLARKYSQVRLRPARHSLTGTIVGTLSADSLIGASQVVILDRGRADGVEIGNPFEVVRRGDAYAKVMKPASLVGQDDPRFPQRIIGQIIVVDVGTHTSLAMVTTSSKEAGVGDHVVMKAAAH